MGPRNKTAHYFQEQLDLVDRVMRIIMADDPGPLLGALLYEDLMMFACQCMWHLKDWIRNDPHFGAKHLIALSDDIHAEKCLMICADLANGSKHFSHKPKTVFSLAESTGIHINPQRGIFQAHYYIICPDRNDAYHGMEIRPFLSQCREVWERIIDKHYLSDVL